MCVAVAATWVWSVAFPPATTAHLLTEPLTVCGSFGMVRSRMKAYRCWCGCWPRRSSAATQPFLLLLHRSNE